MDYLKIYCDFYYVPFDLALSLSLFLIFDRYTIQIESTAERWNLRRCQFNFYSNTAVCMRVCVSMQ